jgi:hypothetical protein
MLLAIGWVFSTTRAFRQFVLWDFGDFCSLFVAFFAKVRRAPAVPGGHIAAKLAFVLNVVRTVFGTRGAGSGALGSAGAANQIFQFVVLSGRSLFGIALL